MGSEEQEKERGSRGVLEEGKDCLFWDKGKDGDEEQEKECKKREVQKKGRENGEQKGQEEAGKDESQRQD